MIRRDETETRYSTFEAEEPRDLFYRVAAELVDLARHGATSLSLAEALAVLLKTSNHEYYQYHPFNKTHFARIERLLARHRVALLAYSDRSIDTVTKVDKEAIIGLFRDFEQVLGPVGASKALHLLARRLFPLWDCAIAEAYDLPLRETGSNADGYWNFLLLSQQRCAELMRADSRCWNPVKALYEHNYNGTALLVRCRMAGL